MDVTLWYRPIEALKFGLNYAYESTYFLQNTVVTTTNTNKGESHRLEFCAYMFF